MHLIATQVGVTDVYSILNLARPPQLRSSINRSTCFRRFVAGWANLGFMTSAKTGYRPPPVPRLDLLRFRDFAWNRFGASGLPRGHARTHISIIQKNMSHAFNAAFFSNVDTIVAALQSRFGARVSVFGWQGMALSDQVREMAKTDLMIALPGSDVMNGIFMPSHSALVIPHRYVRNNTTSHLAGLWTDSTEVRLWFNHLPFRKIIQYNPGEDGETTVD